MATSIRDLFHDVGNWHNKISVGAGVTKAELSEEKKVDVKGLIKRLSELEQFVMGADKVLGQLKDVVYKAIDPDTGKPR
ncbi:MAG: hypothetical protein WC628_06415 [Candidatus Omnitrophota bacterium]